jgi:hypothetical protein
LKKWSSGELMTRIYGKLDDTQETICADIDSARVSGSLVLHETDDVFFNIPKSGIICYPTAEGMHGKGGRMKRNRWKLQVQSCGHITIGIMTLVFVVILICPLFSSVFQSVSGCFRKICGAGITIWNIFRRLHPCLSLLKTH